MTAGDGEFIALDKLNQAERRYRGFLYVLACLVFLAFMYTAYTINQKFDEITSKQQELVAKAQLDGRTRTEEFRRYITCIFIIPVEQRTPENQLFCYRKSDLPGGRTEKEFVPIEFDLHDADVAVIPNVPGNPDASNESRSSSSSNNNANSSTSQPNTSQPSNTTNKPAQQQPQQQSGPVIDLPLLPPITLPKLF
jgi:hypothetical protein